MIPEFQEALPVEVLEEAMQVWRLQTVLRGNNLFYPTDSAATLYYLRDGWVRLFQLNKKQEEITLSTLSRGEIFGEGVLIPGEVYGAFAEAMTDAELVLIPQDDLLRLAARFPKLQLLLFKFMSRRLMRSEERLRDLRFREVFPRLAKALLRAAKMVDNGGYEVMLSHQDLAYIAGTTRETATKTLGELALQDVIELGYRCIVILDREALRRAVG